MPLEYKIDILSALKKAGYNTTRLRKEKILSESTIQKFRRGQMISSENLATLCELLQLQPGDLISFVSDNEKWDALCKNFLSNTFAHCSIMVNP